MEAAAVQDERRAGCFRRNQPAGQPQLAAQVDRGVLLRQHRVRPGLDGETVNLFRPYQPAEPVGGFEQHERHAPRGQLERRRETGDAATDEGNHEEIQN